MGATLKIMLLMLIYVLRLSVVTSHDQRVVEMSKLQRATHPEHIPNTFSFASYYMDHMVLQKAPKRAIIWGYALNIGERIIVKVSDRGTYTTKVYRDPKYNYGVWKIKLPAESSAGPFTITAISSEKTIQLQDVLFGDVWMCSGQSNMQFTVIQGFNATEEIVDSNNYPDIRVFTVYDIQSPVPIPDLKRILQKWSPASNSSVGGKPWKYFSAVCWLYGKALYKQLGYPIGLIDNSWGGTIIELWSSQDALAKCGVDDGQYEIDDLDLLRQYSDGFDITVKPPHCSYIWNAMVNPLTNMTIYGVVWYQGESNTVLNVRKYNCTFPTMIDDWREKFHSGSDGETDPVFPFGFVQLAPKDLDSGLPGFPEVRWHQTANYGYVPNPRMQNVFMSVAIDLPDFASPWASVHIRDKQDVGARLALSGLNVAYNHTAIVCQGPLPSKIVEGTNNISLVYATKIKYNNRIGFEALCPVKNSKLVFWIELPILSPQSNKVVLWSGVCGEGKTILGVRYLWKESPCPFKACTVYSAENPLLPSPPFVVQMNMTNVAGTVHSIDWDAPVPIAG